MRACLSVDRLWFSRVFDTRNRFSSRVAALRLPDQRNKKQAVSADRLYGKFVRVPDAAMLFLINQITLMTAHYRCPVASRLRSGCDLPELATCLDTASRTHTEEPFGTRLPFLHPNPRRGYASGWRDLDLPCMNGRVIRLGW
jgi:hypothetical protein